MFGTSYILPLCFRYLWYIILSSCHSRVSNSRPQLCCSDNEIRRRRQIQACCMLGKCSMHLLSSSGFMLPYYLASQHVQLRKWCGCVDFCLSSILHLTRKTCRLAANIRASWHTKRIYYVQLCIRKAAILPPVRWSAVTLIPQSSACEWIFPCLVCQIGIKSSYQHLF